MSQPKTPTTDQIRTWIDNSSFLEDIECEEYNAFKIASAALDNSDLLTELQSKLDALIEEAYEDGQFDKECNIEADELSEELIEKVSCNFVVHKFASCQTLEDFQREYSYIYSEFTKYQ